MSTTGRCCPSSPAPGLVEFDATRDGRRRPRRGPRPRWPSGGPVEAVGIANQRASTVVWDRATGEPVGPGIGWQDLRTVGTCLVLQADGVRLAPNLSATKLALLLDSADPDRSRDLCFGTVDSWLAWTPVRRARPTSPTPPTPRVTGLLTADAAGVGRRRARDAPHPRGDAAHARRLDRRRAVEASALAGAPPIAGIAGDQQASLVGQGCVAPGPAKITFGTGGMLDLVPRSSRPAFDGRGARAARSRSSPGAAAAR